MEQLNRLIVSETVAASTLMFRPVYDVRSFQAELSLYMCKKIKRDNKTHTYTRSM